MKNTANNYENILDDTKCKFLPKPNSQTSENQDYTSQEQSEDSEPSDEITSTESYKQLWRSRDSDVQRNIPRQVHEVFVRMDQRWDSEVEFTQKLNDIWSKVQSYSDNFASTNQIQLYDCYKQFLSIGQSTSNKKNKREQEENYGALDNDLKFTKSIIVTEDAKGEDGYSKYLTSNVKEKYQK